MTEPPALVLAAAFLLAAVLYSSVGHAGASGYLAALAFVGVAPATMKPTALVLNLLVASIATYRFGRAGAAVLGGVIGSELGSRRIGTRVFRRLLALVLMIAGANLIFV